MNVRDGSRTATTSKVELFVIKANYYYKEVQLGCCAVLDPPLNAPDRSTN